MAEVNIQALTSKDWRERRQAIEQLAHADPTTLSKSLLAIVREHQDDPAALNAALQLLTLFGVQVLPGLIALLDDPQAETRMYAAQALGELRAPQAGPALLSALTDPDINVRYHVVEALGKVAYRPAISALLEVLRSRDFFLAFPAIGALRAMPSLQSVPALIELLDDVLLAGAAAEALGDCGDLSVIQPLLDWLETERGEVEPVAQAFFTLHRRYQAELKSGDVVGERVVRGMGDRAWERLLESCRLFPERPSRLGRHMVSLALWARWVFSLVSPLQGYPLSELAHALIGWLRVPSARQAASEALAAYREAVPALLDELPRLDAEGRQTVVKLISRMGDERAVPVLRELLQNKDDDLVALAADALGKLGAREAIEDLLALFGHASPQVRFAALAAVNSLGHPEHTKWLLPLLADPRPTVRELAVRSLGYFGDPTTADAVLDLWTDPEAPVRRVVLEVAPFLGTERALEVLFAGLEDPLTPLRVAAVRGLAHLPPAQALPRLRYVLQSERDLWLRVYAVRALGRLDDPAALDDLARLAGDPLPPVRMETARALGRLDGDRAVALLTEMVYDPVDEVAQAAIEALAATKHPGALATLREALVRVPAAHCRRVIQAIAAFDTEEAVQTLVACVRDPAWRKDALEALGHSSSPQAPAVLVEFLLHEPEAAEEVFQALTQSHPAWAVEAVRLAWQNPDLLAEQRRLLVQAMRRLRRTEVTEMLLAALDDPSPLVRECALTAVVDLGIQAAWPRLFEIARSDPELQVRATAQRLIQQEA